jgi:ABC-type nitrate/sulfonate/bicarbonate transport system permease component
VSEPSSRDASIGTLAPPSRLPRNWARLTDAAIYAMSIALVVVAWEWSARRFGFLALFPPPSVTFPRLLDLARDGSLGSAALVSVARILAGFLIGSAVGVVLGLLTGSSPLMRALLDPYIHFLRFIPPLAWFAPVLLWFGTGELTRVILIVYTTIFIVTLNTAAGVAAVPANKPRMARAFGASDRQVFLLVTLPACVPFILTGMRLALGNSFATVVAAEMLAANNGLGYMIASAQMWMDIAAIFSAVIVLGILGFLADRSLQWLTRRFGGQYLFGSVR